MASAPAAWVTLILPIRRLDAAAMPVIARTNNRMRSPSPPKSDASDFGQPRSAELAHSRAQAERPQATLEAFPVGKRHSSRRRRQRPHKIDKMNRQRVCLRVSEEG